jgi:hypothetical protein
MQKAQAGDVMRKSVRISLLLSLLLAHVGAQAQIYMCKDASGHTITADRPIAECMDRPIREYDRKGMPRRDILPPPTAEQKRQMRLEEDKRRLEELAEQEQRRSDRAMRARYRDEADIEFARNRSLETVQEQMRREKSVLAAAEKRRRDFRAEADGYAKRNVSPPEGLQRRIDASEQSVRDSERAIKELNAQFEQINVKYDETLSRFRLITGVAAK